MTRGVLRVVIAGGGTGGHLFPGIAVADELTRRGAEVRFIGSDYGIERTAVPRAGYPVDLLAVRGLRGTGLRGLARALWRVPASVLSAGRLLGRYRVELVIGVGGYASFPAVVAAALRRIPIVLLEQNARAGLATRVLAPLARRICVSFPETARGLGARAVVTGNPVRDLALGDAASCAARPADERFGILVFGGSAGAHRLNLVVPDALGRVGRSLAIVHQTGARDREDVAASYEAQELSAEVLPFIEDMRGAYAAADLAVCRAGATTLAELTAIGLPAILVPFPFAAGDHQRVNAEAMASAGAARVVLERELTAERLAREVRALIDDRAALAAMSERSRALGRPDAARRVVEECLSVMSGTPASERREGGEHANARSKG